MIKKKSSLETKTLSDFIVYPFQKKKVAKTPKSKNFWKSCMISTNSVTTENISGNIKSIVLKNC